MANGKDINKANYQHNQGDPTSMKKFQEVLAVDTKRAEYDSFGSGGDPALVRDSHRILSGISSSRGLLAVLEGGGSISLMFEV